MKKSIAEGIAIANPIRGTQILAAVKKTGGCFVTVSENEIRQSLREVWRKGYYIEPTSASTVAGIKKYFREYVATGHADIRDNDSVVSVFTGHGLKSTGTKTTL
ncbi:MAG: pyridoxal-phosphate dependent enzyme [bacterium]|nr:pyridoxal-phosphate dependent enzyme [bacterium]